MQTNEITVENNLSNNINIESEQKNFLETTIGSTINSALNIGLRAVLPDFIEDSIVNIKDILIENGIKEGIPKIIESAINVGKSALGIITGKFENMEQVKIAVEKGGIIDKTSTLIDYAINKASSNKLIKSNVAKLVKQGKNTILDSVSSNLEKMIESQEKAIENLEKYCETWTKSFEEKNFSKMEKNFQKISENLENVIPIEKIINKAREIENVHNLVKSKNGDFNLSTEELELSKILK